MFGIITCNKKSMTEDEQTRYQSLYCSLCHSLKKRYGQLERMTLSYDMTFLAMLLNGLYEGEENGKETKCILHPFSEKNLINNKYIDYAADMTILMAYYKCVDDWEDEHKYSKEMLRIYLQKDFESVSGKYPRQAECVRCYMESLASIEKNPESTADEAVNCSGLMLSELFVYEEDFWSDALRKFGYELGRFVYLMDAALDYDEDTKKQNYNPLFRMNKKPCEIESLLEQAIGNAAFRFEQLPIVQDVNILRNILYAGVWQQYYIKVKEKRDKDGK